MNNANIFIPHNAQQIFIAGPVGKLDCLLLSPLIDETMGIAIVFHPDPKGGGTYTNKIVQTIAKTLCQRGYICITPNLRGVGLSDGSHDMGIGEIDDGMAVLDYLITNYPKLPLVLGGFSFGSHIASSIANILCHIQTTCLLPNSLHTTSGWRRFYSPCDSTLFEYSIDYKKLILIGPAVTKYPIIVSDINKTIAIHGEDDEVVPANLIEKWSRDNNLPVIWFPNTGHFFHGKLVVLQNMLNNFVF